MNSATSGTERSDRFTAFIRRLAEYQAYALSGDVQAQQIMNQYGSLEWAGHKPDDALTLAELEVAESERGK